MAIQRPSLAHLAAATEKAWIRRRRKQLGLLQREAAEAVGVATSTWKFWETEGAFRPSRRVWWKLVRLLGPPRDSGPHARE